MVLPHILDESWEVPVASERPTEQVRTREGADPAKWSG